MKPEKDYKRIRQIYDELKDNGCVMCGVQSQLLLGAWSPSNDVRKRLKISLKSPIETYYVMCRGCQKKPDALVAIETKLIDDLKREQHDNL